MEDTEITQKPKRAWKRRSDIPSTLYSIPLSFGIVLDVKNSANAWWIDKQKLDNLIAAFRMGCTIEMACAYAKISERQYKYFVRLHPQFTEAREGFILEPSMLAKMTIMKGLLKGNDLKLAQWYAEKRMPEFAKPSRRGGKRRSYWPPPPPPPETDSSRALKKITQEYREKLTKLENGEKVEFEPVMEKPLTGYVEREGGGVDILPAGPKPEPKKKMEGFILTPENDEG